MEKKLRKIYLTYYNLLTVQDLWQAPYMNGNTLIVPN